MCENPFLWSPFESLCQIGELLLKCYHYGVVVRISFKELNGIKGGAWSFVWVLVFCVAGERPDPEQIFRLTSLQSFSGGNGGGVPPPPISPAHTPSNNMGHRQVDTVLMETPQDTLVFFNILYIGRFCLLTHSYFALGINVVFVVEIEMKSVDLCHFFSLLSKELNRLNLESSNSKYSLNTDSSVSYIDSSVISPDSMPLGSSGSLLSKQVQNKPKSGRCLLGGTATLSPLTPR